MGVLGTRWGLPTLGCRGDAHLSEMGPLLTGWVSVTSKGPWGNRLSIRALLWGCTGLLPPTVLLRGLRNPGGS